MLRAKFQLLRKKPRKKYELLYVLNEFCPITRRKALRQLKRAKNTLSTLKFSFPYFSYSIIPDQMINTLNERISALPKSV
jgi:hypothetical protein